MSQVTDRSWQIRRAEWPGDIPALRAVREPVFVSEQQVPLELEWDEDDPRCIHVLAEDPEGRPIGTGRLAPDGKIGRMAVLREWRGTGVGGALLQTLIDQARAEGLAECRLNSQTEALDFYGRYGFVAEGPEFDEAGIPHRFMRLSLEGPDER